MNQRIKNSILKNQSVPDVMQIISAKYDKWSYEQETRLYSSLTNESADGYFYQNFDEVLKLKEVYIGANAQVTEATFSEHIKPYKSLKVTKVRTGFRDFEIVPQRNRNEWFIAEDEIGSK